MFRPLNTRYQGTRATHDGEPIVIGSIANGRPWDIYPGPSLTVRNHSPTGFNWGYAGSGPAQLALALLMDFTKSREWAERYYQQFKFAYVCGWTESAWQITGAEIAAWMQSQGAAIAAELPPDRPEPPRPSFVDRVVTPGTIERRDIAIRWLHSDGVWGTGWMSRGEYDRWVGAGKPQPPTEGEPDNDA